MAIVRSVASQKIWGDFLRLLLKYFTPNRVHILSKRRYVLFSIIILTIIRFSLSNPSEWVELQARRNGCTLETTIRKCYRLLRFFKEHSKQYRSHQTIQRIPATRDTTPPLRLPTGDNIGERNVGDIVNWSPEFISM